MRTLKWTAIGCLSICLMACAGQEKVQVEQPTTTCCSEQAQPQVFITPFFTPPPDPQLQVGEYVRKVFEDSNGSLWFATLMRGVARYDEKSFVYFSRNEGLSANQVNDITEDSKGNMWFATTEGVSRFDGTSFTHFGTEQGLSGNSTWSIFADRDDNIWVGTLEGLSKYDGKQFTAFALPTPDYIKTPAYVMSPNYVRDIVQDKAGNLWFATDGYGVCKYDGQSFEHFTNREGLCSDAVVSLLEDQHGNMWFGSTETYMPKTPGSNEYVGSGEGGLSMYDGETVKQFPEIEGLSGADIYPLYEDRAGNIWISSKHYGVYRFDGEKFKNYKVLGGTAQSNCIQSILQDKSGNLWFGFSGGLFLFDGVNFKNILRRDFLLDKC